MYGDKGIAALTARKVGESYAALGQDSIIQGTKRGNCEEELPKKPVGRQTADSRPTDGRQSADSRPTVGRLSAVCRPTVGRQSADRRPTGFA